MNGWDTHDKMNGLKKMNFIDIKTGDALYLFKEIESESVDLIIADPPYNLRKDYGNNHDFKEFEEYIEFCRRWLCEAKRTLKSTGTIYVFMGVRFISYLFDILDRELELFFNSWITWHYTQGMGRKVGFSPRHDDILMFTKSTNFIFNLDAVRVPQKFYRERNNMRGANPGDVWEFSHVHYCNENRQAHPTQKPEGLIERMILASSNVGDFILDPFSGSGTTLRVSQQLDRKCVGFEINPEYVNSTRIRLATPFEGFDSIDPRMERLPNDLRDIKIRSMYLKNHVNWFLKNHKNAIRDFQKAVREKYGTNVDLDLSNVSQQESLF